jgi:hypothetical protein
MFDTIILIVIASRFGGMEAVNDMNNVTFIVTDR